MTTHRIYYIDEDDGHSDVVLTDPAKYIEHISESGIEAIILDLKSKDKNIIYCKPNQI